MARRFQSSFAAGELDPALAERTTLEKYDAGLKTARNVVIGKTGRIISRFGSEHYLSFGDNKKRLIWTPPDLAGAILDITENSVRVRSGPFGTGTNIAVTLSEFDIDRIHFVYHSKSSIVHLLVEGNPVISINLNTISVVSNGVVKRKVAETGSLSPAGMNGTGYRVDYAVTTVDADGIESEYRIMSDPTYLLPVTVGHRNNISQGMTLYPNAREMRVYRRPFNGGQFGYIGSSYVIASGFMAYADSGQQADYEQQPPDHVLDFTNDISMVSNQYVPRPKTGIIYQGRFIMSGTLDKELIHASRTNKPTSWTRDYPFSSASGITTLTSGDGTAPVRRFLDAGPLIAFTNSGIYANDPGAFTPVNAIMSSRGEGYIIQDNLPPLKVPGAILFVDERTNSVMAIQYSDESVSFQGEELSIYSAHLLRDTKIRSWTYLAGDIPVVLAVCDNGRCLAFSYQKEQNLRAWTWFDHHGGKYKQVVSTRQYDGSVDVYYVVERGGLQYMEKVTSRSITNSTLREFNGFDSTKIWSNPYGWLVPGMDGFRGAAPILVEDPDDNGPDGPLTISSQEAYGFSDPPIFENAEPGDLFRIFFDDESFITFTIDSVTNDHTVVATPDRAFPLEEALKEHTIYYVATQVTGLTHLAGEDVSVHCDGAVVSCPLDPEYPTLTVSGLGVLELPEGVDGSFIKVGLPIPNDVETLDVATVEQKPVTLESKLVSKLYVKLFNSRGVFTGQSFPTDDTVTDMEPSETRDSEIDVNGNGPQLVYTKRVEIENPSDWDSNGRVCVRAVHGYPVEILSILPDMDVFFKGG